VEANDFFNRNRVKSTWHQSIELLFVRNVRRGVKKILLLFFLHHTHNTQYYDAFNENDNLTIFTKSNSSQSFVCAIICQSHTLLSVIICAIYQFVPFRRMNSEKNARHFESRYIRAFPISTLIYMENNFTNFSIHHPHLQSFWVIFDTNLSSLTLNGHFWLN
jgi:hypothetical protein